MNPKPLLGLGVTAVTLVALLWLASPTSAQISPVERVFHNPKPDVEAAVQRLRATLGGPLPILEGFVETTDEPLDRYQRGYYQCVLQLTPSASGGTLVRITAKITAWYSADDPAQSGYRSLPSNGRLERDLLARLEQALARSGAEGGQAPQLAPASAPTPTAAPSPLRPNMPNAPTASRSPAVPAAPGLGASPPGLLPSTPPINSGDVAANDADLTSLAGHREEAEKRMEALKGEVQNLEEILHNQAHPTDLIAVRKSGTPVFAKPQTNAHVLFLADAEDEFEILGRQGTWVHVQIAGLSRGWIRRAQVDLPEELSANSSTAIASGPAQDVLFRVAREQTTVFAGDWEPLRGKIVRMMWVESSSGKPSSPQAKLDFAKPLLLNAYKDVSARDQTVAGVVIVFDSADGGQIAATLASLKQWQAGNLSEASFWQQASLDPPESFR